MQARFTEVLGLHRAHSRVSIHSITSFTGSISTKKTYKKLFKDLHQIGVTAEMITQKEEEILDMFRSQNTATSSQIDGSNISDDSRLPAVSGYKFCLYLFDRNLLTEN